MLLWASKAQWQPNMMNYNEVFVLQSIALMDNGHEPTREEISKIREEALVLSIVTEKREGFNRQAAIPFNPDYEHWSKQIYDYITSRQEKGPLPNLKKLAEQLGNGKPKSVISILQTKEAESIIENYEPIFPFRRQEILPIANRHFEGFTYPIAQYNKKIGEKTDVKGKVVGIYETIPEHQKRFGDHALRHLRATELKTYFLIEGATLSKFMGWTTSSRTGESAGGSSAMESRYVTEAWREAGYFSRLLRRRA